MGRLSGRPIAGRFRQVQDLDDIKGTRHEFTPSRDHEGGVGLII
jgi:hypothetical protein